IESPVQSQWPARSSFAVATAGVLLFAFRSVPQTWNYWDSAVANSTGLQYLDRTDYLKNDAAKADTLHKAEREFSKAITLNPTFVTSYYKLAHVYNSLAYYGEARRAEQLKSLETYRTLAKFDTK